MTTVPFDVLFSGTRAVVETDWRRVLLAVRRVYREPLPLGNRELFWEFDESADRLTLFLPPLGAFGVEGETQATSNPKKQGDLILPCWLSFRVAHSSGIVETSPNRWPHKMLARIADVQIIARSSGFDPASSYNSVA